MNCRLCGQKLAATYTGDGNHLEPSPIDPQQCLGCFMGVQELQLWFLRATGRSMWTLKAEEKLRQLLDLDLRHRLLNIPPKGKSPGRRIP